MAINIIGQATRFTKIAVRQYHGRQIVPSFGGVTAVSDRRGEK